MIYAFVPIPHQRLYLTGLKYLIDKEDGVRRTNKLNEQGFMNRSSFSYCRKAWLRGVTFPYLRPRLQILRLLYSDGLFCQSPKVYQSGM